MKHPPKKKVLHKPKKVLFSKNRSHSNSFFNASVNYKKQLGTLRNNNRDLAQQLSASQLRNKDLEHKICTLQRTINLQTPKIIRSNMSKMVTHLKYYLHIVQQTMLFCDYPDTEIDIDATMMNPDISSMTTMDPITPLYKSLVKETESRPSTERRRSKPKSHQQPFFNMSPIEEQDGRESLSTGGVECRSDSRKNSRLSDVNVTRRTKSRSRSYTNLEPITTPPNCNFLEVDEEQENEHTEGTNKESTEVIMDCTVDLDRLPSFIRPVSTPRLNLIRHGKTSKADGCSPSLPQVLSIPKTYDFLPIPSTLQNNCIEDDVTQKIPIDMDLTIVSGLNCTGIDINGKPVNEPHVMLHNLNPMAIAVNSKTSLLNQTEETRLTKSVLEVHDSLFSSTKDTSDVLSVENGERNKKRAISKYRKSISVPKIVASVNLAKITNLNSPSTLLNKQDKLPLVESTHHKSSDVSDTDTIPFTNETTKLSPVLNRRVTFQLHKVPDCEDSRDENFAQEEKTRTSPRAKFVIKNPRRSSFSRHNSAQSKSLKEAEEVILSSSSNDSYETPSPPHSQLIVEPEGDVVAVEVASSYISNNEKGNKTHTNPTNSSFIITTCTNKSDSQSLTSVAVLASPKVITDSNDSGPVRTGNQKCPESVEPSPKPSVSGVVFQKKKRRRVQVKKLSIANTSSESDSDSEYEEKKPAKPRNRNKKFKFFSSTRGQKTNRNIRHLIKKSKFSPKMKVVQSKNPSSSPDVYDYEANSTPLIPMSKKIEVKRKNDNLVNTLVSLVEDHSTANDIGRSEMHIAPNLINNKKPKPVKTKPKSIKSARDAAGRTQQINNNLDCEQNSSSSIELAEKINAGKTKTRKNTKPRTFSSLDDSSSQDSDDWEPNQLIGKSKRQRNSRTRICSSLHDSSEDSNEKPLISFFIKQKRVGKIQNRNSEANINKNASKLPKTNSRTTVLEKNTSKTSKVKKMVTIDVVNNVEVNTDLALNIMDTNVMPIEVPVKEKKRLSRVPKPEPITPVQETSQEFPEPPSSSKLNAVRRKPSILPTAVKPKKERLSRHNNSKESLHEDTDIRLGGRRARAPVSYKEPSMNMKMRRPV